MIRTPVRASVLLLPTRVGGAEELVTGGLTQELHNDVVGSVGNSDPVC